MSPRSNFRIIVNSLFSKNSFHGKSKECQVSKTNSRYKIRLVNTHNICKLALYGRYDAASKNHHDQKRRSLRRIFP